MIEPAYRAYVTVRYLEVWRAAQENLPNPDSTRTQDVRWCDLLAGPVTVREPQAAYTLPRWRLGGRPWRVLQMGDFRIPVFLHKGRWSGLYPQHFVRMTAYCRLIEEREGFRSPYGIVLRAGTYQGVTVPNTARTQGAPARGTRRGAAGRRRFGRDERASPARNGRQCVQRMPLRAAPVRTAGRTVRPAPYTPAGQRRTRIPQPLRRSIRRRAAAPVGGGAGMGGDRVIVRRTVVLWCSGRIGADRVSVRPYFSPADRLPNHSNMRIISLSAPLNRTRRRISHCKSSTASSQSFLL